MPGEIYDFRHSLWHRREVLCPAPDCRVCGLPARPCRAQRAQLLCSNDRVTCILQISDQSIPAVTENIKLIQRGEVYGCPCLYSGNVTAIIRLQEQRGHYIMLLICLGWGHSKRISQLSQFYVPTDTLSHGFIMIFFSL